MVIPIFDYTHQPIPAFLNLLEHAKNQFIPSLHSWDTVNFRVPWPDRPHPFLTMPTQNLFDHILIYVNSYHQHTKNQAVSLIFLEIWLIKNSCNLIGWEHFGPYLRNQNFLKNGICAGTLQKIQVFVIERIQYKLIVKFKNFSINSKNRFWPLFCPFSRFWG